MSQFNPPYSSLLSISAENPADILLVNLSGIAWQWNIDTGEFQQSVDNPLSMIPGLTTQENFIECLEPAARASLKQAALTAHQTNAMLEKIITLNNREAPLRYRIIGSPLPADSNQPRSLAGVVLAGEGDIFLNDIFENLSAMVYVKDLAGRYLFANRQYLSWCNKSLTDIVGYRASEIGFAPIVDAARFDQWVLECSKPIKFEEQLLVAGELRYFSASRFPIKTKSGEIFGFGGVLIDMTEDKQLIESVIGPWHNDRQLLDAVSFFILCVDLEGRIEFANRMVLELLQSHLSEIKGKTLTQVFLRWDQAEKLHNDCLRVAQSGKPLLNQVLPFSTSGNRRAKVDQIPIKTAGGETEKVLLVASDISQLVGRKENQIEFDIHNQTLVANSLEAIFCLELQPPLPHGLSQEESVAWIYRHGRYRECNEKFARYVNLKIDDVIGNDCQHVLGRSESIMEIFALAHDKDFSCEHLPCRTEYGGMVRWVEYSFKGQFVDHALAELWGNCLDVTDAHQNSLALQHSEARYRSFIANSHEGIFHAQLYRSVPNDWSDEEKLDYLVSELVITECNDEYARQQGKQRASECVGLYLRELEPLQLVREKIDGFLQNNCQLNRYICRSPVETECWVSINMEGVFIDGNLSGCWGTQLDVTERQKTLQRLEYQVNHDNLTHLPNRQKLCHELETYINELDNGECLALMLIDLDRFKEINDTLGHEIGDTLLCQLGPRLEKVVEKNQGLVARLGGDEFGVVLAGLDEATALMVAQKILQVVNRAYDLEGFSVEIGASVGIAFCPRHSKNASELFRFADIAMYQAKSESRGLFEYNTGLDRFTKRRLTLMTDLHRAVRENQFCLYFQPKIDIHDGVILGFEALLRWRHPDHGFLMPGEFIPLVESTEAIRPMTLWVLDAALKQCAEWKQQGFNTRVSINLSARNLLDETIVEQVQSQLAARQLSADFLELEITESAIMLDPERAASALDRIGALGVHLSIDDFGTGYSSLAYLKRLPVNSLKIDYSFVKDMLVEQQDAIIVHSTINLAHNLGLKVVAEGVESHTILQSLDKMHCDIAQGYYIARPMPAEEVLTWCQQSQWQGPPTNH